MYDYILTTLHDRKALKDIRQTRWSIPTLKGLIALEFIYIVWMTILNFLPSTTHEGIQRPIATVFLNMILLIVLLRDAKRKGLCRPLTPEESLSWQVYDKKIVRFEPEEKKLVLRNKKDEQEEVSLQDFNMVYEKDEKEYVYIHFPNRKIVIAENPQG